MQNGDEGEMVDPEMLGLRSRLMTVLQNAQRRDTYVGLDTIAVVCDTIAVDARFNMWIIDAAKRNATEEQFIELLERYEALAELCFAAVSKFHEDHEKSNLQGVVRDVATKLTEIMKTGLPNPG